MFRHKQAILFDLDGTLVHSAPDLVRAVNAMLREFDLPEHPSNKVQSFVGNGAVRFVERALAGEYDGKPPPELFRQAFPRFRDFYEENLCVESYLYEGVMTGLAELDSRGLQMACVTNKAERFTIPLLEQLGISHFFKVTVSGDTLATRKPDPAPLQHACDQLGVGHVEALMVGDTRNDIDAATAIGMDSLFVTYGYGSFEGLPESSPGTTIDKLMT